MESSVGVGAGAGTGVTGVVSTSVSDDRMNDVAGVRSGASVALVVGLIFLFFLTAFCNVVGRETVELELAIVPSRNTVS